MARAITSDELTLLRSHNQRSNLFLYIHKPKTVFTAQVAASISNSDEVSSITYNNATGNPADVLDGMTVYVGTTAGAQDVGVVRARSASGGTMKIGITSDVVWTSGLHITVVDEFRVWARKIRYNGGIWNIEGEITYTNQNEVFAPIPNLGAPIAVKELVAGVATFTPSAVGSWCPDSTISSYSWSSPGAASTSGLTTISPTITYNAPGIYRVSCTVTAANGISNTGHRYCYVPGTGYEPIKAFYADGIGGDVASGGWKFNTTLFDNADTVGVRNGAMVVLYGRDYYGNTLQSIGHLAGYENVIVNGWIEEQSIDWNPEQGAVKFKVSGPSGVLGKISAFPVSLLDSTDTSLPGGKDWMHVSNLTVDKGVWHQAVWRSTMSKIMDVYPSGDTRRSYDCSGNLGSLWEQLKAFCVKIGADPVADRYGRLFVRIDPNLVNLSSRSSIPVVMDVTKNDWTDTLNIQKRDYKTTSLIEVAGFNYANSQWNPLIARSPGNAMSTSGSMTSRYNFLFSDQSQANEIAGLLLSELNNPFPVIPISFGSNNRMIDIAPMQYLTLTVGLSDTPAQIDWSSKRIIPTRVEIKHDIESGLLSTNIECKAETGQEPGVTVTRPETPIQSDLGFAPIEPYGLGINLEPINVGSSVSARNIRNPLNQYPSDMYDLGVCMADGASSNGPWNAHIQGTFESNKFGSFVSPFYGYVRKSSAVNKTRYTLNASFWKRDSSWNWVKDNTDDSWYTIYLLDSSNSRICAGTHDPVDPNNPEQRTGYFNVPNGSPFDSIEIHINQESLGANINDVVFWDVLNGSPDLSSLEWNLIPSGLHIKAFCVSYLKHGTSSWPIRIVPNTYDYFWGKHLVFECKHLDLWHAIQSGTMFPLTVPYFASIYYGGLGTTIQYTYHGIKLGDNIYFLDGKYFVKDNFLYWKEEQWGNRNSGPFFAYDFIYNPYEWDNVRIEANVEWVVKLDSSHKMVVNSLFLWNTCARDSTSMFTPWTGEHPFV